MEAPGEEIVEPLSPMHTEKIDVSGENAPKNCDSFNHRRLLSEAVKLGNQVKFLDFAWGMEMQVEEVSVNPLKVLELDLDIQLPISLQSIQCLKEISLKAFVGEEGVSLDPPPKQTWEIGDSKICSSALENDGLSSMIMNYLQLPHEIGVAAKFKKLVLYAGQQCFTNSIGSWWVDGKFGTLLLQVPVEGGHQGGHLNIEYHGRKKKFESYANSDKIFYLSSFYDCCEHFIEPVLQGNKLMLVYDLIWTNAKIDIPQNFPLFHTAMKQIKKAVKSWFQLSLLNSKNEGVNSSRRETETFTEPSLLLTPETQLAAHPDCLPPGFVVDSSTAIATKVLSFENDSLKNEAAILLSEEDLKENILFVVLNEKYDEKLLAFELLRRWDRIFAEALLQCDYLEVHLALAKQKAQKVRGENSLDVEQFESLKKQETIKVLEVSRLIDSNNVARNLSIELNWDKQFVGSIQPNQEKKVENEDRVQVEIDKTCSTYGVLVLWPKQHSVQIYCHFGIHALLIQMSKSLACLPERREDAVRCTKSHLRQLISFCRAEPRKAWIQSGMEKGELTLRLLRFCIALQAREEGLNLLRILGSNFEEEHNNGIANNEGNFEGIQNEEVALAIARFEYQIAGWSVIAELIKRMVNPNRMTKQLIPICKLSKSFLNVNCFEGARVVADCVSSFFHKVNKTQASKAKLCDIQAYIDMMVALETNGNTSNRERIEKFILLFSKLRPSVQCRLVLDFAAQKNHCLENKHPWQFIFRDVCEILSVSCKIQSPPSKTIAFDFMKAIEAWLLELSQEIELRPELQELIESHIDLEYAGLKEEASSERDSEPTEASVAVSEEPETLLTSSIDKTSCQASLELWDTSNCSNSQGGTSKDPNKWAASADDWSTTADKSKAVCNFTVSTAPESDDWNAASDVWASRTQSQITSTKTLGGKESIGDDWGEKADSFKADSIVKEIVPRSSVTQPNDDWGACADAWASNGKATRSSVQGGTSGRSQSDWGAHSNVSTTSSTPIASDDWNSLPSYSNATAAKTTYAPKCGPSDDWAISEDPWGAATERSNSWTSQSIIGRDTGNSWTSGGYTARSGGRGGVGRGTPRPCRKCNEEGHTSYDCPTRGRGRGSGATRGQRPCYKCNQEGHMAYECPTGPTRGGRGGGRGRGTRLCYKCNQEGHISYDCPTGGRGGGRASARPFYDSSFGATNSSNNQPAIDDWGTLTSVPNSRSSTCNASERTSGKGDVWGTSNSTSDPWATGANSATSGARNTSGYNAPSRNKQPEMDDWGIPSSLVNAAPASLPVTSTRRNGSAAGTEPEDWGLAADAWSSVTTCNSSAPSTRPNAVASVGGDDWATEAEVWSGKNGYSSNVKVSAAANEINDWSGNRRTTVRGVSTSDPRLVSSELSPIVWNGILSHRSLCFKINLENIDKNSSPDLVNLAMPSRLKVVGIIEPEKVWNYLKQIKATSHEKIVVFNFTPSVHAEISYMDCYNYFLDGFCKRNWFGVIGSVPDSKLPCSIKDFYVIPLPKEEPIPKELESVASTKFLRENRVSDLLLAIIVIQNKRPIEQASFGASTRPSKVAKAENNTIAVDEAEANSVVVQEVDAAIESQSATSQPPNRLAAIRQKLQQDIMSVDPVKARIHTAQQFNAKKPSSKLPIPGKLLPAVQATNPQAVDESSDAILQADKEASPSQMPIAEEKSQILATVDGELLMKQAIMEELDRQIEASKQGKMAEVEPPLQPEIPNPSAVEYVKPVAAESTSLATSILSGGPLTRSRTKQQAVEEEVAAFTRTKITTSSRSSHRCKASEDLRSKIEMLKSQRKARLSGREMGIPKEAMKRRCFVGGCRSNTRTNSIYCSDECIVSHVRDSLNAWRNEKMKEAQLQEPSSVGTSLTPPSTSSDESAWKDSIDCSLLINQPTPALASKLLAITQMRKSVATVVTKPDNLAEDTPVPVLQRTTGKILCGSSAPKVDSLEQWLKSNSTYEIIKPDSLPIKPWLPIVSTTVPVQVTSTALSSKAEVEGRISRKSSDSSSSSKAKVSRKRSAEMSKEEESSTKVAKPDDQSTRAISKSTLKEALWNRCKEVKDLETDEAAVEKIASEVEESLYSLFKRDVGTKYKSKYRSLIYNIKDPKNIGLFLEIVTKQITPVQLVRMSTEELASKDLAEWREREVKRQLDMIQKNEHERLSQVNKYLIKTHKGEEFIKEVNEDFDTLDEDTSKMAVVPDTPSEATTSNQMPPKSVSDSNLLDSNQTVEEKDEISKTGFHSSSKKSDDAARSRSTRRSSRHSESHFRGSDYYRSERRLEKKDRERHDRHSSSGSKSKTRSLHQSQRSVKDKKQEKKKEIHEYAKAISQPTEFEGGRFIGHSDGEEPSNPSQRLSADDEAPISAANNDTILLQNKLVKQLAVLEELNRQSGSPEREFIEGLPTLEMLPESRDSVTSGSAIPSTITTQLSKSKEHGCKLLEDDSYRNGSKETVIADVRKIDNDYEEHCNVGVRSLVCKTSSPDNNEEDLLSSPGKLVIAEDDDSFLDLDEQFLKQQAIVEELNSSLTTFIVANNIDIQSHCDNLDPSFTEQSPNTPPGMQLSNLKERDILEVVEPSRSSTVFLPSIFSTDEVPDQSKQTSFSSIELHNTNSEKVAAIAEKRESLHPLPTESEVIKSTSGGSAIETQAVVNHELRSCLM